MFFNHTKNISSGNKSKGFTPRNPHKSLSHSPQHANTPINREPQLNKYNADDIIQEDKKRCAEIAAAIETVEILTAIPEQIHSSQDLLNLLKERDSYLDKVKFNPNKNIGHVMLTDRPRGKNLLEHLSPDFIQQLCALKNATEARKLQKQLLNRVGFDIDVSEYKEPINRDFRHVIRMEFNGRINKPDEESLSDAYLDAQRNPSSVPTKPEDYNLEASPAWQFFKKFPNFKNIEADFRKALSVQQLPPDAVCQMNTFDFEDALFNYKAYSDDDAVSFRLFEGAKEAAVKIHAHNHRKELEAAFKNMGAKPQDVENLLNKMEKQGRIPPLSLPDGSYLTASVHHDTAILDAGNLDNPTHVNHPENMRIVFKINERENPENQDTQIKDADMFKVFNNHKIAIDDAIDLNEISASNEAKKAAISKISCHKMAELVTMFRALEIDDKKIVDIMTPMMKSGEIPPVELSKNRLLAMDLRQTRSGLKLTFGVQEKSSEYTDHHREIFHGNSTRPVYIAMNGTQSGNQIIPHEGENTKREDFKLNSEKDIYAIDSENPEENKTKVSMRVHAKLRNAANGKADNEYPVFFIAGLGENQVVWSNEQDRIMTAARIEALSQGQKQFKYGDKNYVR